MTNLTRLIKNRREKLEISQGDIARCLGLTNCQMISNIERGEAEYPPKHFKKLSKLLKMKVDLLINMGLDDYQRYLLKEIQKAKKR